MIVGELTPANIDRVVADVTAKAHMHVRTGLLQVALGVENEAKTQLARTTHPHGTGTASQPGSPPSLVSGTLRRSITHSPISFVGGGWETRVGTATGLYPPYGRHETASSLYGKYLETGLRNGSKYPFLLPSFKAAVKAVAAVFSVEFRKW